MVSKAALRRRKKQGPQPTPSQSPQPHEEATSDVSATPSILSNLTPYIIPPLKVLFGLTFGLTCAASLQSERVAVVLFLLTLLAIFVFLFKVFHSMLSANDQTLIPLPTVYKADGTVIRQSPLTVMEHDRRVAHYYSAELPMLVLAAAWFHLWARVPGTFLVLALYTAHRLCYHPLFRVHVFSDRGPGTERPFGTAPLFASNDPASRVRVVAGLREFRAALAHPAADALVVVDVSAPWCGPCQAIAPVFRTLADEFAQVTFLTIDVDVSQDVATELGITSVPSFLFFMGGQRLELMRGGTEQTLRKAIQSHLS